MVLSVILGFTTVLQASPSSSDLVQLHLKNAKIQRIMINLGSLFGPNPQILRLPELEKEIAFCRDYLEIINACQSISKGNMVQSQPIQQLFYDPGQSWLDYSQLADVILELNQNNAFLPNGTINFNRKAITAIDLVGTTLAQLKHRETQSDHN